MNASVNCYAKHPCRAAIKIAIIIVVIALLAGLIAMKLNDPALDRLKFNLSLSSLIGIVVVINLISTICIALLYAAYQWVRRDLKAPRSEDISGTND